MDPILVDWFLVPSMYYACASRIMVVIWIILGEH